MGTERKRIRMWLLPCLKNAVPGGLWLARSFSEIVVFLHSRFAGSAVIGIGLLDVLPGTDTFFVHGSDQDEDVGVVFEYQRTFD